MTIKDKLKKLKTDRANAVVALRWLTQSRERVPTSDMYENEEKGREFYRSDMQTIQDSEERARAHIAELDKEIWDLEMSTFDDCAGRE